MDKLKYILEETDPYLLYPVVFSGGCIVLLLLSYLVAQGALPPRLPLFYSLPWGESQLITKQQFLLLPALSLGILLINTFLASQLHPSQIVLKRILLVSVVAIDVVFVITGIKIITLFV